MSPVITYFLILSFTTIQTLFSSMHSLLSDQEYWCKHQFATCQLIFMMAHLLLYQQFPLPVTSNSLTYHIPQLIEF